jgi:hypothetical protein
MITRDYLELGAMAIMLLVVLGIFIERIISKRGLGARIIQFMAVGLIVPVILILALEGKLATETTATIIGALIGYLLSGIGNWKSSEEKDLTLRSSGTAQKRAAP